MNLKEFKNSFRQKDVPKITYSILIIDMDFDTTDEEQSTTSQSILKRLKKEYEWIQYVPTLCVVDSRLKKTQKRASKELENNLSTSAIQHPQGFREPVATPIDDIVNPFDFKSKQSAHLVGSLTPEASSDSRHQNTIQTEHKLDTTIKKPFKNSSLISILHELLSGDTKPLLRKQRLGSVGSTHSQQVKRSSTRKASSEESEQLMTYLASVKTLIVDDNPVNLKVLARMLTQIGISSEKANNGREAYETILNASKTDEPFQLVFMDIWMPELNGFEATEKIRQEDSSSSTLPYIIALTACVMTGDREKCIKAGMNGYVSKPLRKEELEAAIHTFIQTTSVNETN